jgi:hypothetical protein
VKIIGGVRSGHDRGRDGRRFDLTIRLRGPIAKSSRSVLELDRTTDNRDSAKAICEDKAERRYGVAGQSRALR